MTKPIFEMRMLLYLITVLLPMPPVARAEVGFSLDLSRQEIIFGETLYVNMTITPNEHIQDQTLEVRFPPKLLFSASVKSTTCDSSGRNCVTDSKTMKESELSKSGRFIFDNRVIEESSQLIVLRNTSNWEPGWMHQTEIYLSNIATADLTGREFVVGVFRYWNRPRVNNEENGVQNFVGRNFTLYPAKIYVLVDGQAPNKTGVGGEQSRIYSGVEKSITLVAETDPRAGTMIMKVELPTVPGSKCETCNGSQPARVPLLDVVKTTYTLGQGTGANQALPLPSNQAALANSSKNDGTALVLTPDMLNDGSGGTCSGSCRANLTSTVVTDDRYAKPGQQINISASIYYGPNFTMSLETPPVFMTIVGPELDLQLAASPDSDLEAGMEVRLQASLRHSSTSAEDLVVTKVAFSFPDNDAIKLVPGSGTMSRNGSTPASLPDANITQGVLIGDFQLKSTAEIAFKVSLTDAVPLNSKLPVTVGADFAFKRASDACLPEPCLHGGTCVPATDTQPARCQCSADFDGRDCSKRICKRGTWRTATETSDICYYFPNKVLPFTSAYQECAQLGTSLPAIHSAASDLWALASYWMSALRNVSEVWIGLSRDPASVNWKWIDGTPVNLVDWYDDNQPNGPGDCVVASSAGYHNYRWLNRDCSLAYYFFCADPPKSTGTGQRSNSRNAFVDLNTKKLNIKSSVNLGDRIRIHQPVTLALSFAMPLGTLRDAQLETVFASSDVDPLPLVFVSSDLSVPSEITCTRPDILHAKRTDFSIKSQSPSGARARRKRAAAILGRMTVTRPLGTLVNSVRGGKSGAAISLNATFLSLGSPSSNFSGGKFSMTPSLGVNNNPISLGSWNSMFAQGELVFNKTFQSSASSPGEVLVTAVISHSANSTGPVYDLNYLDDLECLRVRKVPKDIQYVASCKEIRAKRSQLDVGDSMVMTYAISADKGLDYEPSFRNATINFTSIQPGEFLYQEFPGQKGAMEVSTCIIRKDDVTIFDRTHIHLYSGLAFLFAIILAALIVLLVLYLYWRWKRANRAEPSDEERLLDGADGASIKSGSATAAIGLLKRSSSRGSVANAPMFEIGTMTNEADDTIVAALIEPGPQEMFRHLDRMDVSANVAVEDLLHSTKLQNFVDAAISVAVVNVPDEKTGGEMVQKLRKRVDSATRRLEQEQKEKLDKLSKTAKIKNGDRVSELKQKQAAERADFSSKTDDLSGVDKEAVWNSLKAQQQAELDDLLHKLRVEQELELQKLGEELQAKKEGLLLDIQAQLVKDSIAEGKIDVELADTLSQEMDKGNAEVLRWFDTERARQRAMLEEKSQTRRHLAMQKELWDQQYDELIEILIKQYFDAIDYLMKKGLINEAEAQELRQTVRTQVRQLREWLEKERRSREAKLQKMAAAEKKKRVGELKAQQQKDIDTLAKNLKETKMTMTDPLQSLRELQKLAAEHRGQLRSLETRLDEEATDQLYRMYQDLQKEFSQTVEDKKKGILKAKNVSEQDIQALIAEHRDHIKILMERHEFQRQKLSGKLEETLQHLRRQAVDLTEREIADQAELRQHEKTIARMLIDQQASLSDADRDALVRMQLEHLANMKNSLALNRLNQIQLLERKLAERKAGLVERLERRRHLASKPARKSTRIRPRTGSSDQGGSSSMSSEDERPSQNGGGGGAGGAPNQMSMIDYTQQRLHIARDTTLNVQKEVEAVRQALHAQRAQLLKEREETLGALVAQLQIDKAKQIVDLEQQEDALNNLTTCMVEDLNDRGVLSNPDCHRILEKHQIEQQRLSERLQEQKEKQDLVLKHQLSDRASKKRTILQKKQQRISESRPITAVDHIDNINLIHDYALQREKLAQQSEREMEQALQEQRREFELKKRQALQDQEIDLINTLVTMGEFRKAEVSGVLRMLFPDKTKEEVRTLAKKVYKKAPPSADESKERRPLPPAPSNHQPSLAKRLEMTSSIKQLIEDRASPDSGSSPSGLDIRRKRENGVRVQYARPRSRPRTHLPPISKRPEPVGASVDQVAEYLPDRRIARVAPTPVAGARQTYHQ